MDVIFILIGFGIGIWALYGGEAPKKPKCPPHKWIYRQQDENTYMVCEKCKSLPNGNQEES